MILNVQTFQKFKPDRKKNQIINNFLHITCIEDPKLPKYIQVSASACEDRSRSTEHIYIYYTVVEV